MNEQQAAALAMVKAIYEDGEAEINGRRYVFNNMIHKDRRKVFAFYTSIGAQAQAGDLSFLDTPRFSEVEAVINNTVTIDGSLLSKVGDEHWEKYPGDYVLFIQTALGVISYPFAAAVHTA